MEEIIHKEGLTPGRSWEKISEYKEWGKYPAIEFRSQHAPPKEMKDRYNENDRYGITFIDNENFLVVECYEVKTSGAGRVTKRSHSYSIRKSDIEILKQFINNR